MLFQGRRLLRSNRSLSSPERKYMPESWRQPRLIGFAGGMFDFHEASTRNRPIELDDREWLYQKYVIEGLSVHQIANLLGCGSSSVHRALVAHEIARRPAHGRTTPEDAVQRLQDAEWCRTQRIDLERSLQSISNELRVSLSTCARWMRVHNIQRHGFTDSTRQLIRESRLRQLPPSDHTRGRMSQSRLANASRARRAPDRARIASMIAWIVVLKEVKRERKRASAERGRKAALAQHEREKQEAEERRAERAARRPCPYCGQRGGLCDEHRERLAKIRDVFDEEANAKRPGASGKRGSTCCAKDCMNRRDPSERYCAECRDLGRGADDLDELAA